MTNTEARRDLVTGAVVSPLQMAIAFAEKQRRPTQQRLQSKEQLVKGKGKGKAKRTDGGDYEERVWTIPSGIQHPHHCPWCGQAGEVPGWDHIMWHCQCRPKAAPAMPEDPTQRRYGWPMAKSKHYNEEVLRWMEEATETLWSQRHGTVAKKQRELVEAARKNRRLRLKLEEEKRRQESSTDEQSD